MIFFSYLQVELFSPVYTVLWHRLFSLLVAIEYDMLCSVSIVFVLCMRTHIHAQRHAGRTIHININGWWQLCSSRRAWNLSVKVVMNKTARIWIDTMHNWNHFKKSFLLKYYQEGNKLSTWYTLYLMTECKDVLLTENLHTAASIPFRVSVENLCILVFYHN